MSGKPSDTKDDSDRAIVAIDRWGVKYKAPAGNLGEEAPSNWPEVWAQVNSHLMRIVSGATRLAAEVLESGTRLARSTIPEDVTDRVEDAHVEADFREESKQAKLEPLLVDESRDYTILVVDDEEDFRYLLEMRLRQAGYRVLKASDGIEALRLIGQESIDLVSMNISMPPINGLEILERIREIYSSAELPVIMVTAKDQSDDLVEALGLGANDYITKPIDIPVLLARVSAQLRLTESHRRYFKQVDVTMRIEALLQECRTKGLLAEVREGTDGRPTIIIARPELEQVLVKVVPPDPDSDNE